MRVICSVDLHMCSPIVSQFPESGGDGMTDGFLLLVGRLAMELVTERNKGCYLVLVVEQSRGVCLSSVCPCRFPELCYMAVDSWGLAIVQVCRVYWDEDGVRWLGRHGKKESLRNFQVVIPRD